MSRGARIISLYAEILKKTMAFLILFATIPLGVKGMCAGLILYSFVDMIIITYYTRKLTRLGMFVQICELSPILFPHVYYGRDRLCNNVTKHTSVRAISHWGASDRLLFISLIFV